MTTKRARIVVTVIWVAGALPLLTLLILRHLSGFYGPDAKGVWAWAAQFVFPNLTLIAGAWSATPSAENDALPASTIVFWGAVILSLFEIVILFLVLGSQSGGTAPQVVFEQSALFLGLLQALLIGWLGKFFIDGRR
jgi:hypothetical protein